MSERFENIFAITSKAGRNLQTLPIGCTSIALINTSGTLNLARYTYSVSRHMEL